MIRFSLALMVIGGVLIYTGYKEYRLSTKVKDQAQTMKLADLAANGPGDNANIKLTNFQWGGAVVYEEESGGHGGKWKKVWVPVVPDNAVADTNFNVIFMSTHAATQGDLAVLEKSSPLNGVVINEVDSLGSEEKKLLRDSYPQVNLDKCWIFEHQRDTPGTGKMLGLAGGGVALVVVGGGMMIASGAKKA